MAAVTRPGVRIFLYLFVALMLVTMLFPFYWIVNMSLQNSNQLYDIPPHFWPPSPPWRTSPACCWKSAA